MKKFLLIGWLTILFSGIIILFWYNEWVYSLPTPVPKTYRMIKHGDRINLSVTEARNKPLFLHFFNPDCPCSRFNMPYVKTLIETYKDDIDFKIVVLNENKTYNAPEIQEKYNITVPILFEKMIADSCGVYSTPQAVIIKTDQTLYYRGNYNKSRYCTSKESEYARIAIDSLLNYNPDPEFNPYALKAYGCTLPDCEEPDNK